LALEFKNIYNMDSPEGRWWWCIVCINFSSAMLML